MDTMVTLLADNVVMDANNTPMAVDALNRIRDPVSPTNPLLPYVPEARAILGFGLYITRGVRCDALFLALALSQFVVNHLTKYVWNAHLRWTNYLVQTWHLTLILRLLKYARTSRHAPTPGLINDPVSSVSMADIAAASYGGFALFFPGFGAFARECLSSRRLLPTAVRARAHHGHVGRKIPDPSPRVRTYARCSDHSRGRRVGGYPWRCHGARVAPKALPGG